MEKKKEIPISYFGETRKKKPMFPLTSFQSTLLAEEEEPTFKMIVLFDTNQTKKNLHPEYTFCWNTLREELFFVGVNLPIDVIKLILKYKSFRLYESIRRFYVMHENSEDLKGGSHHKCNYLYMWCNDDSLLELDLLEPQEEKNQTGSSLAKAKEILHAKFTRRFWVWFAYKNNFYRVTSCSFNSSLKEEVKIGRIGDKRNVEKKKKNSKGNQKFHLQISAPHQEKKQNKQREEGEKEYLVQDLFLHVNRRRAMPLVCFYVDEEYLYLCSPNQMYLFSRMLPCKLLKSIRFLPLIQHVIKANDYYFLALTSSENHIFVAFRNNLSYRTLILAMEKKPPYTVKKEKHYENIIRPQEQLQKRNHHDHDNPLLTTKTHQILLHLIYNPTNQFLYLIFNYQVNVLYFDFEKVDFIDIMVFSIYQKEKEISTLLHLTPAVGFVNNEMFILAKSDKDKMNLPLSFPFHGDGDSDEEVTRNYRQTKLLLVLN